MLFHRTGNRQVKLFFREEEFLDELGERVGVIERVLNGE